MPDLRSHANPPTVLAALALFVALGGSSFAAPVRDAASKLVSGKQIKNNSVASADIKNNSVASGDVRNGSLLKRDFKAGQIPTGPTGPAGPQGKTGATGLGKLRYVAEQATFGPGGGGQEIALCPTGTYPTGGGAIAAPVAGDAGSTIAVDAVNTTFTGVPNGWTGFTTNPGVGGDPDVVLEVSVVCAPGTAPDPIPSRIP